MTKDKLRTLKDLIQFQKDNWVFDDCDCATVDNKGQCCSLDIPLQSEGKCLMPCCVNETYFKMDAKTTETIEWFSKYLRQEAIKWVKALNESEKEWNANKGHGLNSVYPFVDYNEVDLRGFITHFFNLTDEELR